MNHCGFNHELLLKLQLGVPFDMTIILIRYNHLHVQLEHVWLSCRTLYPNSGITGGSRAATPGSRVQQAAKWTAK